MTKRIIVAIDGPAGAGKSSVAKAIAKRLGFQYIDSGAMYRAVALWALRQTIDLGDHNKLVPLAENAAIELRDSSVWLNGEDVTQEIRGAKLAQAASRISTIPGVRRALVAKQQAYGEKFSLVMEGRDIGTVVFPYAHVKIFLNAAPEVRATRRVEQEGGEYERVLKEIRERDDRDSTRADSPLQQAPDAEFFDSSTLPLEEVVEEVLKIIRKKTSNGKGVTS